MNFQEIRESQITALHELYRRITEIARTMGGTATEGTATRRLTVNVAVPRDEYVPSLAVQMPDTFSVEFAPPNVLGSGNALSVRGRRLHYGSPKNDWTFNLMQGVWRYTQEALSDEEVCKCLTPDGPRPAVY
jgi:hypothetical protein